LSIKLITDSLVTDFIRAIWPTCGGDFNPKRLPENSQAGDCIQLRRTEGRCEQEQQAMSAWLEKREYLKRYESI